MTIDWGGLTIERALLEDALPREWARTSVVWREPTSTGEVYFWRGANWPSDGTARIFCGTFWIDGIGIVHPEAAPARSNVVPREGWVLAINDRAVTEATDFASVLRTLQEPSTRRRLGLPLAVAEAL